jgi:RNA polymerase sigma factor (sigma-70 family)
MSAEAHNDAELVSESLSGNRDAFGRIVAQYQSLICSLAYSATGSLSQSEDLAQETFLAAWKQLADLREPHKLRAWLCGIARNLINYSLRRQGREPSHAAEPLDTVEEPPSLEPLPPEQAIGREEEAILWRSLERIPEIYREPLVLFYREHQSIEAVAQGLELSEDAVKQRLSRGRKLLHEQVLAFVEGALERTNPDRAFTAGVLAALPVLAATAKSATVGATAAKSGTAIKMLFMTKTTTSPHCCGSCHCRSYDTRCRSSLPDSSVGKRQWHPHSGPTAHLPGRQLQCHRARRGVCAHRAMERVRTQTEVAR